MFHILNADEFFQSSFPSCMSNTLYCTFITHYSLPFVLYGSLLTLPFIQFLIVSCDFLDSVDVDVDATLDTSNHEIQSVALLNESDASSPEIRQYSLEGLSLGVPPDQMRMIQNINTLISEVAPVPSYHYYQFFC